METGTTSTCSCQWIFHGMHQSCWKEKPWNFGKFYGSSYFVDPRGQIFAQASEDKDELLIAEFDLDMIEQVRSIWQFFRDRRPETYGKWWNYRD